MIDVPHGVRSCLYAGIDSKLNFIIKQLNSPLTKDKSYLQNMYADVKEAVDFYMENCVLSSKYLEDKLNEIAPYFEEQIESLND